MNKEFQKNFKILKEAFEKSEDSNTRATGLMLCEHLEFMNEMLSGYKKEIDKSGLIVTITNGKDVFTKENPAVTSFNKNHKEYITTLKQIIGLLPSGTNIKVDSFEDF